jgi:hypothetical protein
MSPFYYPATRSLTDPGAWSMSRLVDCFTGSGPVTARIMLLRARRSKDLSDVFEPAGQLLFVRYFF